MPFNSKAIAVIFFMIHRKVRCCCRFNQQWMINRGENSFLNICGFIPLNSVMTDKKLFDRFFLGGKAENSYDITGKGFSIAVRYENSSMPEN